MLGEQVLLWFAVGCFVVALAGFLALRWKPVGVRRVPNGHDLEPSGDGRYRMSLVYSPGLTDGDLLLAVRHPGLAKLVSVSRSQKICPGTTKDLCVSGSPDKTISGRRWWSVAKIQDWSVEAGDELWLTLSAPRNFSPRRVKLYRRA